MSDEKSANEVVVKSGKTVDVGGGKAWDIRDAEARMVFVDFLSENRISNGVVCLSLGAVHTDTTNTPVVDVTTRLRMDLVTAQILHATLGDLIRQAQQPPDKSVAN